MLDKNKQAKIARFLDDKAMASAVYEVLLNSFLEPRGGLSFDVQFLAASRISIDFLKNGWKELDKYANEIEQEQQERKQVGL